MYVFFRVIDNAGIKQRRMAALMNVSEALFSMVKSNERLANREFQRKAVHALALAGIRHESGLAYTAEELFVPVDVPEGTETGTKERETEHVQG